jgi:protein SCO1
MTRRVVALLAAGTVLTAVVAVGAHRLGKASARPELPPGGSAESSDTASLHQLGSLWTADDGRRIRFSDLRGEFQVLAMIFTSCPSACPTLVKDLQALERHLPEKLRRGAQFVLITIDPARDTPEVLARYRKDMGLSERFHLLRGNETDVRELSASLGFNYGPGVAGGELVHSRLISVLNRRGELIHQQRGTTDDQRLIAAVERTLEEQRP